MRTPSISMLPSPPMLVGWALATLAFFDLPFFFAAIGVSRTISRAGLSERRPLNEPCRTRPSPVQPRKAISATSFGSRKRAACDRGRHAIGGRRLAGITPELCRQFIEQRLVEAAADAARIAKFAVFVHAEQDRGERPAGFIGRRPADNDEFLLHAALALEPVFVRPDR
jgi:hypothetical protein